MEYNDTEVTARLGESECIDEFRFAVKPLLNKLTDKEFQEVTQELWNEYWSEHI
jgi:hypothetical protein